MLPTGVTAGVRELVRLRAVDAALFVKNSSQWCVVDTKKWSTMSSSLSFVPRTPLPPRFCER
ncbi:hypothetical protein [Streptomyces sp. KL116D]|uniref:hypothetical protein n=1 Tax=Streptomyces sp. KL116D TaxID=3045152 RepID=UPI00355814A2